MRLVYYHEKYGRNFGDLLNDRIFPHYLPDFFNDEGDFDFLGIGSILGLPFAKSSRKKIVFSSGFAYGELPDLDDTYEFHCVRGPLTAEALGIEKSLAVADGAYLLHGMEQASDSKEFDCSIMLHYDNLRKFDWRPLCEGIGLNFIDPSDDVGVILDQISKSRVVLAEAMHAAIAADAIGVPWIPIACYQGVNSFKWRDFTSAVELDYQPHRVPSLYQNTDYVAELARRKSNGIIDPGKFPWSSLVNRGLGIHHALNRRKVEESLTELAKQDGMLSRRSVCEGRFEELKTRLEAVGRAYGAAGAGV